MNTKLLHSPVSPLALLAVQLIIGASLSSQTLAQTPQFACQPDAAGTGWICEQTTPGQPGSTVQRPRTAPDTPAPEAEPAPTTPESQAATEPESPQTAANTTTSASPDPAASRITMREFFRDWIPREQMTSSESAAVPDYCCGAFIDPLAGQVDSDADPAESETTLEATSGFSQLNESITEVDGDVVVTQGYRRITNNESTSINRTENTVLMEGDIEFREPGMLLTGSSAFIDNDTQSNRIESAEYVLHDYGVHGMANSIIYNGESGLVTIDNGELSRCEPGNEFWKLRAESIVLDQESSRGYARKVSLRVGDVPVFYYPFTMPFPLGDARSSGFLPPSVGSTRTGGFDLEVPYYLNLAPHYDATLTPRLLSDRGVMASAEVRYLADWSMNTLNMSHLASDDLFDPATKDILGSDSPPVEDRWFVGFEHEGRIGNRWTTYVDYSAVSDTDYFYDLGSSGLNVISQTHLNRLGRLDYHGDWFRAGVNAHRIDVIDPFFSNADINKPFDRLPQFYLNADYDLPAGFSVGLRSQVTSFDRELDPLLLPQTLVYNGANVTGERINLEPELGWYLNLNNRYCIIASKY